MNVIISITRLDSIVIMALWFDEYRVNLVFPKLKKCNPCCSLCVMFMLLYVDVTLVL